MTRFSPAVDRRWLFAVSGVVWTGVGVMLLSLAATWLLGVGALPEELALAVVGLGLAVLAARLLFRRIARTNIARIESGPARMCVFAFQRWQSWVLTAGMIALGIALRHSALPKAILAVVYAAIGGALVLGGGLYHRRFFREARTPTP
jgi:hypothetical protein